MFLCQMENSLAELSAKTNIDIDSLKLLQSFLHLYDFKERRLSEIENVNEKLILSLKNKNIKKSSDYLLFCMSHKKSDLAKMFNVEPADIVKLFNLCDLMRLPGVKSVRANLYYDCNYKSCIKTIFDTASLYSGTYIWI